MEEKKPQTIMELNDIYRELFYVEDEMVIPLLATMIIGAKTRLTPVWLYLIGPSSGGKTAALSAFSKIPFVTQVSDLTPNTLLSGAQSKDTETSLLKKLGTNFVVVMKDFTTILSKSDDTQDVIMSQLREVYDGHMVKFTGLGHKIEWGLKDKPNRSVFIMASTEGIYKVQEKFAEMGSRGLNYVLKDQDRVKTTKLALKNSRDFDEKLTSIQNRVRDFIIDSIKNLPTSFPDLDEDFTDEIIEVADFTSIARSVVIRDYKGTANLALSADFPMRIAKMMQAEAQLMIHLNGGVVDQRIKDCVFKTAFDCIPKQTKLVMTVLAEFYQVNAAGVAKHINYPIKPTQQWIENLNMFKVVDRVKMGQREFWAMRTRYRNTISKYLNIKISDNLLYTDDETGLGGGGDWFND